MRKALAEYAPWAAGLAAITCVRLVLAAYIPLAPDEAYYRIWALAPAGGYLDHPFMVAAWARAGMALVGDTALGVRLMGPLSACLGTVLVVHAAYCWLRTQPAIRGMNNQHSTKTGRKRTHKPHAQSRIPHKGHTRPGPGRHHERVIEIPTRGRQRPYTVICLVRGKGNICRQHQTHTGNSSESCGPGRVFCQGLTQG